MFPSTISPENFIERLPLALCTCDVEGRITDYNQRAVELWGNQPAQGMQKFSGAMRMFDYRGRPLVASATPVAIALASGTPQFNREVILERADTTRLAVLSNVAPLFDEAGTLVGAVDVFQDISDRKRSEEARRAAERIAASVRLAADVGREIRSSLDSLTQLVLALSQESGLSANARYYVMSAQQELARLAHTADKFTLNPANSTNARPNP